MFNRKIKVISPKRFDKVGANFLIEIQVSDELRNQIMNDEKIVHYQLIDRDFDCASDCMLLWHGVFGEKFKSRFPLDLPEDTTPLNTQPRMDVSSGSNKKTRGVESEELDNKGYVISRVERFNLPTIEQERITGDAFGLSIKFPTLSDAFLCLTNGADNDYG